MCLHLFSQNLVIWSHVKLQKSLGNSLLNGDQLKIMIMLPQKEGEMDIESN